MDHLFNASFNLYSPDGMSIRFSVGDDDPVSHLDRLAQYMKLLANAGYTATPDGLEPGEEIEDVDAWVLGETSNGDPCCYLYSSNHALQYRIATVYVERFDELPFSTAGAKVWLGAAPARDMAAKKGVLNIVRPFKIILAPTGKTTEGGRPVMKFARVAHAAAPSDLKSLDDVEELPFDSPDSDAEFDAIPAAIDVSDRPKWRNPAEAQKWAVDNGYCKNIHEARASWAKVVASYGMSSVAPADLDKIYDSFYKHQLEKKMKGGTR